MGSAERNITILVNVNLLILRSRVQYSALSLCCNSITLLRRDVLFVYCRYASDCCLAKLSIFCIFDTPASHGTNVVIPSFGLRNTLGAAVD